MNDKLFDEELYKKLDEAVDLCDKLLEIIKANGKLMEEGIGVAISQDGIGGA